MSKERSLFPIEETWDLSFIFKNKDEFKQSIAEVEAQAKKVQLFKGRLSEAGKTLFQFFEEEQALSQLMHKVYVYAHLLADQDTRDNEAGAMYQQALALIAKVSSQLSFTENELANIEEKRVKELMEEEPKLKIYQHEFENIARKKAHNLSDEQASMYMQLMPVLEANQHTYSMLCNADMQFGEIQDEKGENQKLTFQSYMKYIRSKDREVRKQAYEKMFSTYKQFSNTTASTLGTQVKLQNTLAQLKKFGSAREAALFANHIPASVYDNLLSVVRENLGLFHRYNALRKKVLGVEELCPYDAHISLIKDVEIKYSIEEAKDLVLKALAPLGEDYQQRLRQAFAERWIDFTANLGKRSGAYSSGCYGTRPYILMNWNGNLNDLFTLVHELGHSLHSFYTWENQPYVYASYSIFLAEIASTLNENLLASYLLEHAKSKEEKLLILNNMIDGIRNTVIRQAMFAEFEQKIHKMEQAGEALTASSLSKAYTEVANDYNGDILFKHELSAYEWSYIPHFYYNFYVYQYATGYSASAAFAKMIREEGQEAIERYLGFLKSGCKDYPIEVLKEAGLDMTSSAPVQACFDQFAKYLEAFEKEIL